MTRPTMYFAACRRALLATAIAAAAGFGIAPALAAAPGADSHSMGAMPGMQPPARATAHSADAAVQAFKSSDNKMMQGMSAGYSGDADQDFVAHMIPHHAGAIDMAKVELQYGKDPALRRLARQIIRAQHREIGLMKKWQASHPAGNGTAQ